jgi:hypothetical protein
MHPIAAMSLDGAARCALIPPTSRPDGRCRDCGRLWPIQANPVEESPGSMETRWRLTAAGGDPRESATESKPPGLARVRVKGCGKSAPRRRQRRRQGKPHREQDQIGAAGRARQRAAPGPFPDPPSGLVARGVQQWASQTNGRRGGKPPDRTRLTGRLVISCLCSAASPPQLSRFRAPRKHALTIKMCCRKCRPEGQDHGKD